MATTFHDSNIELSFFSRLVVHPYYFPSLWLLSTATIIGYVRRSNIRGEPINLNVISAIMKTAWALAGLSAIFGLFLPAARLMALD